MYRLNPPGVFVHESVMADPRYRRRLERVLGALESPIEPVVYEDEALPGLLKESRALEGRAPMGTLKKVRDPFLLFNTYRFDGRKQEQVERLKRAGMPSDGLLLDALAGYGPFVWFPAGLPEDEHHKDKVCRACWRLEFQNGCPHRCLYCPYGGLLVTMVNVEDYIANLARLIEAHPWQETYLFEDAGDVLCLEPELDCLGPLIEFFGTLPDRYLIIHTKSANVDWMLDLKHNGKTIIVWSLSGPTQSSRIEPKTGTTEQRIEAARKCEQAGYTVRYKFKPIIPVKSWREEANETIRVLFERTHPDVISLCCFMWMDITEMKRRLDVSLLDPAYVAAAEAAVEEVKNTLAKPFPEWVRAEIYEYHLREIRRWSTDVPVSLSTENWKMWSRLGATLGCNALNYVCGCGPNSIPWRKKLEVHPFQIAKKCPVGKYELM